MIIINDNRVCPKCGSYSQNFATGYCTNGHLIKENEWISVKEYEESLQKALDALDEQFSSLPKLNLFLFRDAAERRILIRTKVAKKQVQSYLNKNHKPYSHLEEVCEDDLENLPLDDIWSLA